MMFKIFQTVLKNPPEGVLYSVPIFSKRATCGGVVISEPWIADGFYFWESSLENAKLWGRRHCDNDYDIYIGEYDPHDPKCFNLVDDYNCIGLLASAYKSITKEKNRKPKYLNQVFYFLLKDTSFKSAYEIARVPADGGIGSNDCIKFADGARAEYSFNRQIQVCFWKKRSEIADLTKYIENNPENTDDWAV